MALWAVPPTFLDLGMAWLSEGIPKQGLNPSPALAGGFLPLSRRGSPSWCFIAFNFIRNK